MKGLEAVKEIRNMIDSPLTSSVIKQGLNVIEKELKALEIIKNKTISACNCLMILKSRFDNLSYQDYTKLFLTELPKEEYDLLKELIK